MNAKILTLIEMRAKSLKIINNKTCLKNLHGKKKNF